MIVRRKSCARCVSLIAFVLCQPFAGNAQEPAEAHSFSAHANRDIRGQYLLYLPESYAHDHTQKHWPLIIYLHGGSARGDDINKLRSYGLMKRLQNDRNFPFVVAAPLCPDGEIWTDVDAFDAFFQDVTTHNSIDPKRIYLTGHSMGGRGTWYFAYRFPERFAAIAPLSALSPITAWAARLKDTPAWVFHGEKDPIVPLGDSQEMVKALAAEGNQAKFTVLPDRDHYILDTYEKDELFDWFRQQVRTVTSASGK